MLSEVTLALMRAQAAQARAQGYRDAGVRFDPSDGTDGAGMSDLTGVGGNTPVRVPRLPQARPEGEGEVEPVDTRAAAIRRESPTIFGERVQVVPDAEELLWRVAAFLDRNETEFARRNLRTRIRKALDGGDWREPVTEQEVERYA